MNNDDMELVQAYAVHQSEQAFETLVSRYVNLVYSAAIRQVHDQDMAEEITQVVFIILARKAGKLGPKTILPSWLHRTAGFAASNALRVQHRRAQREHEAHMQTISGETASEETWMQIAPLLDSAMGQLGQKDHAALVLRFFENRNFKEVGAALGASEDAAKKRVNRALEKLKKFFTKRGVSSTTVIIAGVISSNSVQAAPVALAKSVTAAAITKGVASSVSTLTLMKGALKLMAWSKIKTALVASIVVLAVAGTTVATIRHVERKQAEATRELFKEPDPNSATGLSISAAKFLIALLKQGELPGFPEGKAYVRKNDHDPGLIQIQIPGFRFSRPGVLSYADTNLVTYPTSRTLVASKNNNGQFIYHFTVLKSSETNEWQLQRAWRADIKGKVMEEYSVQ